MYQCRDFCLNTKEKTAKVPAKSTLQTWFPPQRLLLAVAVAHLGECGIESESISMGKGKHEKERVCVRDKYYVAIVSLTVMSQHKQKLEM